MASSFETKVERKRAGPARRTSASRAPTPTHHRHGAGEFPMSYILAARIRCLVTHYECFERCEIFTVVTVKITAFFNGISLYQKCRYSLMTAPLGDRSEILLRNAKRIQHSTRYCVPENSNVMFMIFNGV